MKVVKEILGNLKLDDFLRSAGKDQALELRCSASFEMSSEKKRVDDEGHALRQGRINFLSAVIQECDRRLAAIKLQKATNRKDFSLLLDEYERFRKLTREVAGRKIYDEIITQMKQQAE